MRWFRRFVWIVAVTGWLIFILITLLNAHPAGEVVAWCILAVLTWVAVGMIFSRWFGIRRQIVQHLQVQPRDASLLQHRLGSQERVDILRALYLLATESGSKYLGVTISYTNLQDRLTANPEPERIEWESVQTDYLEWDEVPANAVFLLHLDDRPFVAAVVSQQNLVYEHDYEHARAGGDLKNSGSTLQIVTADRDIGRVARSEMLNRARVNSVYRGRKVLIRPGESRLDPIKVEFTTISDVTKANIILPETVFDVLHRIAIRQLDHEQVLKQAGHRIRTAVLLHGPPGTGKTLLTRYLVTCRQDTTTISLAGFRRGLIREAFRLARYCEPSIVVIEDVDLIATRRQKNGRGTTLLHELLDELDGLAQQSATIIVMTTNRPDVLEPALASRPGRVSQAIEIPLPDEDCRRRILKLFTEKIDASQIDVAHWVARTHGASPAFLEELIRRAILISAERTDKPANSAVLTDSDLTAAIEEIVTSGGLLTQRLLGYADS